MAGELCEISSLRSSRLSWRENGNRSRRCVFLGTAWRKPLVFPRLSNGGDRSHRSETKMKCGGGEAKT